MFSAVVYIKLFSTLPHRLPSSGKVRGFFWQQVQQHLYGRIVEGAVLQDGTARLRYDGCTGVWLQSDSAWLMFSKLERERNEVRARVRGWWMGRSDFIQAHKTATACCSSTRGSSSQHCPSSTFCPEKDHQTVRTLLFIFHGFIFKAHLKVRILTIIFLLILTTLL